MKPQKKGLMLELMHFPKELIPVEEFNEPAEKAVGKAEMQMAKQLIESMTRIGSRSNTTTSITKRWKS